MGFSISKNGGATVYTIAHFSNIAFEREDDAVVFGDPAGSDEDAIITVDTGPLLRIIIDWIIMQEASSVVSGMGSPVTGAPEQVKYLLDTLSSNEENRFLDKYVVTITFSGGTTIVREGRLVKLTCPMSSDTPLTFNGHLEFLVGITH